MKGLVVCNTGPLIALSLINKLHIIPPLFEKIIIPDVVHHEILEGRHLNSDIENYMKADWINIMKVSRQLDPLLKTFLDMGEAAVIDLARKLKADFVLIDERKARKVARTIYNIHVIGSARILVEAKRNKLLDNVGNALEDMRSKGYWIHDDIVDFIKKYLSCYMPQYELRMGKIYNMISTAFRKK
jgi:predicted nucleic acid-binding protein